MTLFSTPFNPMNWYFLSEDGRIQHRYDVTRRGERRRLPGVAVDGAGAVALAG